MIDMTTLNLPDGAVDVDEAGDFRELRTAGLRMVRKDADRLVLETVAGTRFSIVAATPIRVTPWVPELGGQQA